MKKASTATRPLRKRRCRGGIASALKSLPAEKLPTAAAAVPGDIEALNRHFLLLAKQYAHTSPQLASEVLGIPDRYAETIVNLSIQQIEDIAKSHILLFSLRFSSVSSFWDGTVKQVNGENIDITRVMLTAMQLSLGRSQGGDNV